MKRRDTLASLLVLGAAARPLRSFAQRSESPARVVFVHPGTQSAAQEYADAFRRGLRELGHVVGRDVVIDDRFADNRFEQLPRMFDDAVSHKPQVIVTGGSQGAWAAKAATSTIPIVVGSVANPVEQGLVASLARPGGNITGIAILEEVTAAKALETLRLLMPNASRYATLENPTNRSGPVTLKGLHDAASRLGFRVLPVDASSLEQLADAFAAILKLRPDALRVGGDALFILNRQPILAFCADHRIAAVCPDRNFVVDGGLMCFTTSLTWRFHRAAYFVHRILKGAKPAELPFEQPTKFELMINLKTAKSLGLTVPRALLLRADELIE